MVSSAHFFTEKVAHRRDRTKEAPSTSCLNKKAMLSSVNCDDYFEWRGFGRATSGEEDKHQKKQQHKLPAEHGRRQRHGLWTAKKNNMRKQQEDMFTTLNKSFEYRSHGLIATLGSEELEIGNKGHWQLANEDSKTGDVCGILSIYSDPIDTESVAEYSFLPSQPDGRLKSPQVSASPRRQPLLERSNLPLRPPSYPHGIQRSKKCRAVSLSPSRSALKSTAGRADRENAGKSSNFPF
jgi:hypothetical protein